MPKLDIETETFPRGEYPELPSEHVDDFFAKLDPKIPHRYYNPADDRKNELGKICDSYSRPAVKDKLIRTCEKAFSDFVRPICFEKSDQCGDLEWLIQDFLAYGVLFMNCTSTQTAVYFMHEISLDDLRKLSRELNPHR